MASGNTDERQQDGVGEDPLLDDIEEVFGSPDTKDEALSKPGDAADGTFVGAEDGSPQASSCSSDDTPSDDSPDSDDVADGNAMRNVAAIVDDIFSAEMERAEAAETAERERLAAETAGRERLDVGTADSGNLDVDAVGREHPEAETAGYERLETRTVEHENLGDETAGHDSLGAAGRTEAGKAATTVQGEDASSEEVVASEAAGGTRVGQAGREGADEPGGAPRDGDDATVRHRQSADAASRSSSRESRLAAVNEVRGKATEKLSSAKENIGTAAHDYAEKHAAAINAPTSRTTVDRRKVARRIKQVLIAIVAILLAILIIDAVANFGKVRKGVSVAGIDVGGLTQKEATEKISSQLGGRLSSADVTILPDADSKARIDAKEETSDSTGASTWETDAQSIGATVDYQAAARQAYAVGRGIGFLAGRTQAAHGGVNITPKIDYSGDYLTSLESTVSSVAGQDLVESNISVDSSGNVSAKTGTAGVIVDGDAFQAALSAALLAGGDSSFVAPMTADPVTVSYDEAFKCAQDVQTRISQPVTITYEGQSWTASPATLGSWISTSPQKKGSTVTLTAYLDKDKTIAGLHSLMGQVSYGTAVNATFDVSSGTVQIKGGTDGTGPGLDAGVDKIDDILFGSSSNDRDVELVTTTTHPAVSYEEAVSMGITAKVASFTLSYGTGGGTNREFNIERALSILNGSIVAPGENWDWDEVVGYCSYGNGFLGAGAIVDGSMSTEEGGGICNAATGVYNAAYEAGLPIIQRTNHSKYISSYPLGRDATVSWPKPDLVFENDYKSYLLVTATYNGYDMVVTIWGTPEGRRITSDNSDWIYTSYGRTIVNTRTVYDAAGNVMSTDVFYSSFS